MSRPQTGTPLTLTCSTATFRPVMSGMAQDSTLRVRNPVTRSTAPLNRGCAYASGMFTKPPACGITCGPQLRGWNALSTHALSRSSTATRSCQMCLFVVKLRNTGDPGCTWRCHGTRTGVSYAMPHHNVHPALPKGRQGWCCTSAQQGPAAACAHAGRVRAGIMRTRLCDSARNALSKAHTDNEVARYAFT